MLIIETVTTGGRVREQDRARMNRGFAIIIIRRVVISDVGQTTRPEIS